MTLKQLEQTLRTLRTQLGNVEISYQTGTFPRDFELIVAPDHTIRITQKD